MARRRRTAPPAATIMMLAPMVMTLRMPTLIAEAMSKASPRPETTRAVAEKAAASAEAAVAMQSSLALASMRAWFAMAGGTFQSRDVARAQSAAVEAALRPIAKRVSANHRRLVR